ncbi:hypothetical protein J132_01857 [Termitomyces sp. J132]|nr:hypothetical protein J132_01857 [Termitomyces sp. J132]
MTSFKVPSRSPVESSDSASEPGLAEWTSKIKAMQRQVDADDEAEQLRLEQEIAASRLARKRRSQGFGYAGRTNSDVYSTVPSINSSEQEALQAPTGLPATTTLPSVLARDLKKSTSSDKPMSLAAFMGGNATGPRLRKHAPQQDAHDPTQFDQRAFDRSPHPTFGTGGIALPGIAVQQDGGNKLSAIAALAKTTLTSSSETPLASRGNSETYRRQSFHTHNTETQEQAVSFPSSSPSNPRSSISYNQKRTCESTQLPTPTHQMAPVHSASPALSRSTPVALTKLTRLPTDETPSPSRSLYTAPPLAGPIRPQPRPSTSGPQIPLVAPSKAFTRQSVQKELTPSLSRLQGRGFVQKVSSQLESPPAISETPEKNTPVNGKRTSSVLDRWQPNASQTTPSPSPAPRAVRRSTTFGPTKDESPQSPLTDSEGRGLREAASQPSYRQENIPPRPRSSSSKSHGGERSPAVGLGSATTLVVYKPTPVETPSIDEFGVKPNRASRGAISDFPAPSKPLSHPTKERARKPQKRMASGAPTNPAKNLISSMDVPQFPIEVSMTSGDVPVNSHPPTSSKLIVPSVKEAQSFRIIGDGNTNHPPKMGTDEFRQNPSDLSDSASPINTSTPGPKPVAHSADTPRLVRHALPGLSAPRVEGKLPSSKTVVSHERNPETTDHGSTRRALPGLATSNDKDLGANQRLPQSPILQKKEESAGLAPSTKPPMPSNGNRQIVMDVAQTFNESDHARPVEQSMAPTKPPQPAASTRLRSPGHVEKHSSNYERYSPTVKNEATLAPTPSRTLSRKDADLKPHDTRKGQEKAQPVSETSGILSLAISQVSVSNAQPIQAPLLSHVNFDFLLKYNSRHHYDPEPTTISVEVMAITAIVHRSKSQLNGLVSTSVWSWEGRRAVLGAREQRKLQEIAQKHGTSVIAVQQNSEPSQLVNILGGVLAIRQGSRTRWTPENAAMHLVRSLDGVVYVDEKDLSIKNLCSGYSYCISILDSVYVWYGRGSTSLEKKAALEYGHSLAAAPPIELTEDNSKDDEIFRTILGEDEYANADYWKWRRNSSHIDPRIWRVRADLAKDFVDCLSGETSLHDSVYIIDCIWEFYVIVGIDARAHKQDIELAINVATELSTRMSSTRPYAPTVHTLILPSQLPRDLRLMFRDLDEFSMNKGEIPDHMNVLPPIEAYKHVLTTNWDKYALRDPTLLPLGIDTKY